MNTPLPPLTRFPKPFMIGIAGHIGAGKDTVSSLIYEILDYTIILAPLGRRQSGVPITDIPTCVRRIAFADALKHEVADFLTLLRFAPNRAFSQIEYDTLAQLATAYVEEAIKSDDAYKLLSTWFAIARDNQLPSVSSTLGSLSYDAIDRYNEREYYRDTLINGSQEAKKPYRRLLQLWGTEFRREHGSWNYWLDMHMQQALEVPYNGGNQPYRRYIVTVPDVRFANEADYIVNTWGGAIIHVQRPIQVADANELAHVSESWVPNRETFGDALFQVNNDGSISDLHVKVSEILEQISAQFFGQNQ
ncbi:hypothetical protein [Microcystis phage Mvi-JY20]|uniref:Deoxynucleoside monophosphate kinase n=1 Tax=Microcystis phage Mvi-JY20 TaxID=3128146 RepID=A0AAX4QHG3_9CAUD